MARHKRSKDWWDVFYSVLYGKQNGWLAIGKTESQCRQIAAIITNKIFQNHKQ